jgi:3-oxoacyl-[acyl-carrier-protein] synthase-1
VSGAGALLDLSLTGLSAALGERRVSSREATDAALARIAATDGRVGAFLAVTADRARAAAARYGPGRIAVVVGTSTSGILSTEEAYFARDGAGNLPAGLDYTHTHDLYSLARYVRAALGLEGPAMTVSIACASSARAFIDAARFIAAGLCDAAVVGGADSLCRLTLRGFASLDLISAAPTRPGDADRAGISVGEAAGFALLERDGDGPALLGYGASSDGYHMSAPHPQGAGAIAAMREALARARVAPDAVDYVNLHGTGTRANDAAEDAAVAQVFGADMPCSSTKGYTGHTLGAAGIVEAAIVWYAMRAGFAPGAVGVATPDPAFHARLLARDAALPMRRVLSNSFGFGGANCSLLFGAAA